MLPFATSAEEFKSFLKRFFADSTFQISRVSFPLNERISFIDPRTGNVRQQDTFICKSKSDWTHIPIDALEKGAKYVVFTDTTRKIKTKFQSEFRAVEFSKSETDFNLNLIFRKTKNNWYLIRKEYFEP